RTRAASRPHPDRAPATAGPPLQMIPWPRASPGGVGVSVGGGEECASRWFPASSDQCTTNAGRGPKETSHETSFGQMVRDLFDAARFVCRDAGLGRRGATAGLAAAAAAAAARSG